MRVRIRADFRADLREQLRWLGENRDRAAIESLRTAIDEAIDLLSRFPNTGSIEREEGPVVLRRLILRRLPYVLWFARNTITPGADVWLLRLFHVRQTRPRPSGLPPLRPRRGR